MMIWIAADLSDEFQKVGVGNPQGQQRAEKGNGIEAPTDKEEELC